MFFASDYTLQIGFDFSVCRMLIKKVKQHLFVAYTAQVME